MKLKTKHVSKESREFTLCCCLFKPKPSRVVLCVSQAACRALEQAKERNIKKLVLYTDSKFTINGESEA